MSNYRTSKETIVTINGQEVPAAVHMVSNFAGSARRQPMAVFEIAPLGDSPNTVATNPNASSFGVNGQVVIKTQNSANDWKVIHIGRIVGSEESSGPSGEALIYHSRFDESYLGYPIGSPDLSKQPPKFFNNDESLSLYTPIIMFNPNIRGEVYGNRSENRKMILPESLVISDREKFDRWTLPDAVRWIVDYLIPNQPGVVVSRFVDTFNIAKLEIESTMLEAGMYLPECLTKLLSPYGYDWFFEFKGDSSVQIQIFDTAGTAQNSVRFYTNHFRTDFDGTADLVESSHIHFSSSEMFEKITIIGDSRLVEITGALIPDWDRSLDDTPIADLFWDSPAMQSNEKLRDVWRKWVLERPELANRFQGGKTEISYSFRRPFLPCLTVEDNPANKDSPNQAGNPIGQYRGVEISYTDTKHSEPDKRLPIDRTDSRPGLVGCTDIEILRDEGGIRFNGRQPPLVLKQYGYTGDDQKKSASETREIKLFATCCVDSYHYEESKAFDGNILTAVDGPKTGLHYILHAPDRFPHIEYLTNNSLRSEYFRRTPEIKCTNMLGTMIRLISSLQLLTVEGAINYHGLDNLDVNGLIGKSMLYCRQRSLERGNDRFPVVVGYTLNFDQQITSVQIGSYRD